MDSTECHRFTSYFQRLFASWFCDVLLSDSLFFCHPFLWLWFHFCFAFFILFYSCLILCVLLFSLSSSQTLFFFASPTHHPLVLSFPFCFCLLFVRFINYCLFDSNLRGTITFRCFDVSFFCEAIGYV